MSKSNAPNILMIVVDQVTQFVLPFGQQENRRCLPQAIVPNLTKLADRSAVFENCYSNSPLCVPARASLFTGMRVREHKVCGNGDEFTASIPTLMHHLKHNDYYSTASGKMHFIGPDQLHGLDDRETTDIYPSDFVWATDLKKPISHALGTSVEKLKVSGTCKTNNQIQYDSEAIHRSLEFLNTRVLGEYSNPFFLISSFTQPHEPFQTTQEFWDLYYQLPTSVVEPKAEPNEDVHPYNAQIQRFHGVDQTKLSDSDKYNSIRAHLGMITQIDEYVGALLDALENLDLSDDTVIVFTSDHGEMLGEHGMWYKRTYFDESLRVPLILSWPGHIQPGLRKEVVSHIDLTPTLLDLIGGPTDLKVYGVTGDSFKNVLLNGHDPDWKNEAMVDYLGDGTASPMFVLRKDEWKYVCFQEFPPLLFNLEKDPHEEINLSEELEYVDLMGALHTNLIGDLDVAAFTADSQKNQKIRMYIQSAMERHGQRKHAWDFQPITDASTQYVRFGGDNSPEFK